MMRYTNPLEESCDFLFPYLNLITDSLEKKLTNKVERIQYNVGDKNNFLDITVYPLLDTTRSGAVIRIDDVTQRIQMEDMMVQSEKCFLWAGLLPVWLMKLITRLGPLFKPFKISSVD